MSLDLADLFDAEGLDAPPPALDRFEVMRRGRTLRRRRQALTGGAALVAGVLVVAGSLAIVGSRPHAAVPVGPRPTASPVSSKDLAASCQAFAASDRSSVPKLTYDTALTLVGSDVPVCIVPKPGVDGAPRLEGSSAENTRTPGWATAASVDRPLPSGVTVSRSYDAYVHVDGVWLLARMTGAGSSA